MVTLIFSDIDEQDFTVLQHSGLWEDERGEPAWHQTVPLLP